MIKDYVTEPPKKQLTQNGIEAFVQCFDKPKQIASPHIHSALEFIYIIEGEYRMRANDTEFFMSKGDLCLFRSETVHRTYVLNSNGGSYFVIKIEPTIILNLADSEYGAAYAMHFMLYGEDTKVVWRQSELEGTVIKKSVLNILDEHDKENYGKELALKINAADLLLGVIRYDKLHGSNTTLFSSDVSLTKQIYKAIIYINRNYGKDITALDCAQSSNMSYSYFSRSFKRITGKSFKEYLNGVRINQAEKLLLSTDKSVTEVCFACGYNNVSYFISQYKLLRGKTPRFFRNGM